MTSTRLLSRRSLFQIGAAAAVALSPVAALAGATRPATGRPAVPAKGVRSVNLYNLHTSEKLKVTYWENGKYARGAMREIDKIMRDHRSGQVKPIDKDLIDLLHRLNAKLDTNEPFEIISGYRCPATNAALRRNSSGVARNSYHMRAMAMDLNVPGRDLPKIRKAAMSLRGGGVGYYPGSDFHPQVARVDAHALRVEIGQDLLQHVVVAGLVEVGRDDLLGIGVAGVARHLHPLGGPMAEEAVSAHLDLELQVLIVAVLGLELALAIVEGGHLILRSSVVVPAGPARPSRPAPHGMDPGRRL